MARRLLQRFLESPVLEPSSGKQASIFIVLLYIYVFQELEGKGTKANFENYGRPHSLIHRSLPKVIQHNASSSFISAIMAFATTM
jgi:hypothetical protein